MQYFFGRGIPGPAGVVASLAGANGITIDSTNPAIPIVKYLKHNSTAVVAPTVNADSSAGYSIGSQWYNNVTGLFYVAQSVGVGTASWDVVVANQSAIPTIDYATLLANLNSQANGKYYVTGRPNSGTDPLLVEVSKKGVAPNPIMTVTDGGGNKHNWVLEGYDFADDQNFCLVRDSQMNQFFVSDLSVANKYIYFPADNPVSRRNILVGACDFTGFTGTVNKTNVSGSANIIATNSNADLLNINVDSSLLDVTAIVAGSLVSNVTAIGTSNFETITVPSTGLTDIYIDLVAGISNLPVTLTLAANAINFNESADKNWGGIVTPSAAGTLNTIVAPSSAPKYFTLTAPAAGTLTINPLTATNITLLNGATITLTGTQTLRLRTDGTTCYEETNPVGGTLSRTSDTNVTLTLGGTPTGGIPKDISITAGWAGQLSIARGGTGTVTGVSSVSTNFETSARFGGAGGLGSGTAFGTSGADLTTGANNFRSLTAAFASTSYNVFKRNPVFYCAFKLPVIGASGTYFIGIGAVTVSAAGHTFTDAHIGFKVVVDGLGGATLLATQAAGITETASASLTAILNTDMVEVYAVVTVTGVSYYWVLNGGAISSATALLTNQPTSASATWLQVSASTNSTANAQEIIASAASYSR